MTTKEEWVAPYPVSWKDIIEQQQAELDDDYPEDLWVDPAEAAYSDESEDCS